MSFQSSSNATVVGGVAVSSFASTLMDDSTALVARATLGAASAHEFNVKDNAYGAYGDTLLLSGATTVNTDNTVTCATASFTSADVGKVVFGYTASGARGSAVAVPRGTITAINSSTSIEVSVAATASASGTVYLCYGHNDTAAIQAAGAAAKLVGGVVRFPPGGYLISDTLFDTSHPSGGGGSLIDSFSVQGAGSGGTVIYLDSNFTADGQSILIDHSSGANVNNFSIEGLTLHCNRLDIFDEVPNPFYGIYIYPKHSIVRDVNVVRCAGGLTAGIYVIGQKSHLEDCYVEFMPSMGIYCQQQVVLVSCYSGNNGYHAVYGTGADIRLIGCLLDECEGDSLRLESASIATIVGSTLFSSATASTYACYVDSGCTCRAVCSFLIPWSSSDDRNGVRVISTGILYLTQCTLEKNNSGVALTNAGTVYDCGGNSIEDVSGTAPVLGLLRDTSVPDGIDIGFGTSTGTKLGVSTSDKIGIWNSTPVARQSGFTQTYSTATKTHSNPTAAALTLADGAGTNDNTIGAITADASVIAAFQEVADEINKLVTDLANTKQVLNAVIDDHQTIGWLA